MHNFKEFLDYCESFYSPSHPDVLYPIDGLTREELALATLNYLDLCAASDGTVSWGDGDSLDRESQRFCNQQEGYLMKEFTSTVTLTFDLNNLEAESKEDYIAKLKEQYQEYYNINIMTEEISDIKEYNLEATE